MTSRKVKPVRKRRKVKGSSVAVQRIVAWSVATIFAAVAIASLGSRPATDVDATHVSRFDSSQADATSREDWHGGSAEEQLDVRTSHASGHATSALGRSSGAGAFVLSRQPVERPRAFDTALERRVDALVAKALSDAAVQSRNAADARTCTVALRVLDLTDGAVVLERAPRVALAPASNQKLVTSLTALVALGLDWRFVTAVDAVGAFESGRLRGDLVVRAGGDPLFASDDPAHADRRVAELAAAVAQSGLRRVEGDLVLDLGSFAAAAPAPGWPSTDAWTSSYALAAGLTVNGGLISYSVEPTAVGQRARSHFIPSPTGLAERLDVATVAGRVNDVRVGLYESTGRLDLVGSIGGALPPFRGDFRHPDPVQYFGEVFRHHLRENGVEIAGSVRRTNGAPEGRRLGSIATLWTDYLEPINTHSNNAVADAVLLALGQQRFGRAERSAGAKHVTEVLMSMGAQMEGFQLIDGSGLSRDNRVSVEVLTELIARVASGDQNLRQPFIDSLAISGRTGTLSSRMTGRAAGRVHAKTGFIRGASALTGFVRTEEDRELAFSIVVNYPRIDNLNNTCWKPMHDAIVEELVLWKRP